MTDQQILLCIIRGDNSYRVGIIAIQLVKYRLQKFFNQNHFVHIGVILRVTEFLAVEHQIRSYVTGELIRRVCARSEIPHFSTFPQPPRKPPTVIFLRKNVY